MSLSVNAHHEAGHAVVAVELGCEVEFVTAKQEARRANKTVEPDPSDFPRTEAIVIISLAGRRRGGRVLRQAQSLHRLFQGL